MVKQTTSEIIQDRDDPQVGEVWRHHKVPQMMMRIKKIYMELDPLRGSENPDRKTKWIKYYRLDLLEHESMPMFIIKDFYVRDDPSLPMPQQEEREEGSRGVGVGAAITITLPITITDIKIECTV